MFGFVVFIILALLALVCVVFTVVAAKEAKQGGSAGREAATVRNVCATVAAVAVVVAALVIFFDTWVQIPTQSVGVVTSFGRPVGDLSNGGHFVDPWEGVTTMDNQVQTDVYEGGCAPKQPGGIPVRIADQQTACAQVRIVWQMRQSAADTLFRQYTSPANVRGKLVYTELLTAMNDQFDGYDPIGSLNSPVKLGLPGNPTVPEIAKLVTAQMRHEIGQYVNVKAVLVPIITYDGTVQQQLNTVLKQKAATDVALQAEKTDQAIAAGNKDLASTTLTWGVLVQNCENLVSEAMKTGYVLPATFSCGLGQSQANVNVSSRP